VEKKKKTFQRERENVEKKKEARDRWNTRQEDSTKSKGRHKDKGHLAGMVDGGSPMRKGGRLPGGGGPLGRKRVEPFATEFEADRTGGGAGSKKETGKKGKKHRSETALPSNVFAWQSWFVTRYPRMEERTVLPAHQ